MFNKKFKMVCLIFTLVSLLVMVIPSNVTARGINHDAEAVECCLSSVLFDVKSDSIVEITIINPVSLNEMLSFIANNDSPLYVQINEKLHEILEEVLEEVLIIAESELNDVQSYFSHYPYIIPDVFEIRSFCAHIWVTTGNVTTSTSLLTTHQVTLQIVIRNPITGAIVNVSYHTSTCYISAETIVRDVTCQRCGMPSTTSDSRIIHTHGC